MGTLPPSMAIICHYFLYDSTLSCNLRVPSRQGGMSSATDLTLSLDGCWKSTSFVAVVLSSGMGIRSSNLRRGDTLVTSNKHVDQLQNMPDSHISAIAAHIKSLYRRFSTTTIMLESNLPTRVLQQKLTPSLALIISPYESRARLRARRRESR
ncbi:hypothetical protein F5B17DRAFT_228063 [Nemania serpens]|nr:hypothetical protein F5B17DRAFT_228063 [Nemania serpens]